MGRGRRGRRRGLVGSSPDARNAPEEVTSVAKKKGKKKKGKKREE